MMLMLVVGCEDFVFLAVERMEDDLLNELSRLTLSVEHFLRYRIESNFFRSLRFQTNFIGVDISILES